MNKKKIKLYSTLAIASGLTLGAVSTGVFANVVSKQNANTTYVANKQLTRTTSQQQETPSQQPNNNNPGFVNPNDDNSKKIFLPIIISVSIVFVLIIIAAISIEVYYRRKNSKEIRKIIDL